MNTFIVLALALVAVPALAVEPISLFYHETVGIPEAKRIEEFESNLGPISDGSRIAGGSLAGLGEHPYLAGLLVSLTTGQTSVCAASLLSNTKLITAAHCWWDGRNQGSSIVVVLGSVTLFSGGTRISTSNVEMHASYNTANLNNDIAMITVSWLSYTNVISPIALPTSFLQWLTFEGNWAVVAGYGVTQDNENILLTQSLRHVNAMVVNNLDCSTVYGFNVISSTICTSGQGRVGPCGGDSGGPLVFSASGVRYLIGVTSFHAAGGCDIGFPGGYARVTSFLSWIQNRM